MKIYFTIFSLIFISIKCLATDDATYFPKDYEQARSRFAKHCLQWKKQVDSDSSCATFSVPSETKKNLNVDYLKIPAKSQNENLFIIVSGVHGSEAFAGSAIQNMILHEILPNVDRTSTSFFFVHSMNPYGFKYNRRATENNVNLNRNFSISSDIYLTNNHAYSELSEVLAPSGKVENTTCQFIRTLFDLGSGLLFGDFNFDQLNEAIGAGQYSYANGLEFGGLQQEPQTIDLIKKLSSLIPEYKNVILIDLHTGLGDRYKLHLMPGSEQASFNTDLFTKLYSPQRDIGIYEYTDSDSDGFYHTYGDLTNLLAPMISSNQRLIALTWEFGTVGRGILGKLKTINRLILENQGFHYGYKSPELESYVKDKFITLFNPPEQKWKKNVIRKSRRLFELNLQRFGILKPH